MFIEVVKSVDETIINLLWFKVWWWRNHVWFRWWWC